MHFRAKLTLALIGWSACLPAADVAAATLHYHIAGDDPGPWPQIFSSIGMARAAGGPANLFVVRNAGSWISPAVDPAHRARRHRGAGRPGRTCRRARRYPGPATRGGPQHRRPARAQAANRLGIASSKFPYSMCQRTRAFSRPSAGTMRRSRWFCIEARARRYGSPFRPAKKDTNGSPTCFRL